MASISTTGMPSRVPAVGTLGATSTSAAAQVSGDRRARDARPRATTSDPSSPARSRLSTSRSGPSPMRVQHLRRPRRRAGGMRRAGGAGPSPRGASRRRRWSAPARDGLRGPTGEEVAVDPTAHHVDAIRQRRPAQSCRISSRLSAEIRHDEGRLADLDRQHPPIDVEIGSMSGEAVRDAERRWTSHRRRPGGWRSGSAGGRRRGRASAPPRGHHLGEDADPAHEEVRAAPGLADEGDERSEVCLRVPPQESEVAAHDRQVTKG